ncbi:type IV toxin-antitoxin system AbiEi family antitoxin domain-containing protein [Virgibacillus sp. CBA3643]|uniref:type IV toxin-antitoxin system AbiEi family antitoxin domain-containing protein n=1 Tax=Virgibacillus sp. CBA3643 TaxID=2942278 RepID=UPI0035A2AEDC
MTSEKERKKRREKIEKEVVTSAEALEILGLSRMRLNQFVNEGRIIQIKRGLYLKDDIYAFIESRE